MAPYSLSFGLLATWKQGDPLGTRFFFCQGPPLRTAPRDHQPTATNRQVPTANRQPLPTATTTNQSIGSVLTYEGSTT